MRSLLGIILILVLLFFAGAWLRDHPAMPSGFDGGRPFFGHGLMRECGEGVWLYRAQYLNTNDQPGWVAFYIVTEDERDGWVSDPLPGARPFVVMEFDPGARVSVIYVDLDRDGWVDERYGSAEEMQARHGVDACSLLLEIVGGAP